MKAEQAKRLFQAMQDIKPVVKDKKNPHFKNNYADINTMLEDVKPVLHKHGLFLIQPIENGEVITRIIDSETGEALAQSSLPLNLTATAQQKGSEITYYRRYTLQSLLGLEAEDDDGNSASQKLQPKKAVTDFEAMKDAVAKDPKLLTKIVAQYNLSAEQLEELQTLITK